MSFRITNVWETIKAGIEEYRREKEIDHFNDSIEMDTTYVEMNAWIRNIVDNIFMDGEVPEQSLRDWDTFSQNQKDMAFFNLLGIVQGLCEPDGDFS